MYEIFHWVIPLCSSGDVTPRSSPHHPPTSLPSAPPAPTLWIWFCYFSSTKYNLYGFKMLGKGSQKDVHAVSSKVWRKAKSVKCLWVSRLQCSVFKEFIRTFTSHFVFRGSVWMRDSVLRLRYCFSCSNEHYLNLWVMGTAQGDHPAVILGGGRSSE